MNTDVRIIGKDDLDIEKIRAEINHTIAETHKIQAETKWYSFYRVAILWGSAFGAAAAVIKLSKAFL